MSLSSRKAVGHLIELTLNLYINLRSIAILTILVFQFMNMGCLSIKVFFTLIQQCFVILYTSFIKLILKYYIHFDDIIIVIIFII